MKAGLDLGGMGSGLFTWFMVMANVTTLTPPLWIALTRRTTDSLPNTHATSSGNAP